MYIPCPSTTETVRQRVGTLSRYAQISRHQDLRSEVSDLGVQNGITSDQDLVRFCAEVPKWGTHNKGIICLYALVRGIQTTPYPYPHMSTPGEGRWGRYPQRVSHRDLYGITDLTTSCSQHVVSRSRCAYTYCMYYITDVEYRC